MELLADLRTGHRAAAGMCVHTVLEAEAAASAACEVGAPVVLMVGVARANLGAFVRAVREITHEQAFVQLAGDQGESLVAAARELEADAVYLSGADVDTARAVCDGVRGRNVLTEVVLPWKEMTPGGGTEGRVVDLEASRPFLDLTGLDVAAVPVGGGPGPYKTWRVPLWSPEAFSRAVALREDMFYALPWGSILSKQLLDRYNRYGGALPGVVSLPRHQYLPFLAAGAVKVSFCSDGALAFLGGLRESLLRRPEVIDVGIHVEAAQEGLREVLKDRLRDLR